MDINEDDPRFDAGNDGLYAIMGYNRDKVPESQIKEEFSKFGEIVSLRALDSGCFFVRYGEKSELIDCFKTMSNNDKYNAKLPTSKSSNYRREGRNKDSGQRYNADDQKEMGRGNQRPKQQQQQDRSNNDSFRQQNSDRLSVKSHNSNACQDEALVYIQDAVRGINISSSQSYESSEPPPLKLSSNSAFEKDLKDLHEVCAVEVIVANLPPGLYQSEVYEICRKGQPIHIELSSTPPPYNVNYATVFTKSLKNAQRLVSELNGHFVDSNLLVVALADTILENDCVKQKHN